MANSHIRPKLDATGLDRLRKLCGLFSSDHVGERANAAAMADRLLRDRGLRWQDVLCVSPLDSPVPQPEQDPLCKWPGGWRNAAEMCARYGSDILTEWELQFCINILRYKGETCSDKQLAILHRLLNKVLLAGVVP